MNRVKEIRKERGLTQEILSEKMLTEFEKNVIMGSECKETTEILKIIR